jgi:hypothetical protein
MKTVTAGLLTSAFLVSAGFVGAAPAQAQDDNRLKQEGTYNLGSEKPSGGAIANLELQHERLEREFETNINGDINGDFFLNGDQIEKLGNQVNTTTIGQQTTIENSGDNSSIANTQETQNSEMSADTQTGQTVFQATQEPGPGK